MKSLDDGHRSGHAHRQADHRAEKLAALAFGETSGAQDGQDAGAEKQRRGGQDEPPAGGQRGVGAVGRPAVVDRTARTAGGNRLARVVFGVHGDHCRGNGKASLCPGKTYLTVETNSRAL